MLLWRDDGRTQKGDICSRDPFRHSLDVTWVLSYREFWDLESKMAKEWSMKDMIDAAIRKVNQDFHCTEDTLIVPEELKSFILGKLPEDFDYEGLNIKGKQTNFRACFVTKDITNDNQRKECTKRFLTPENLFLLIPLLIQKNTILKYS